MTDHPRGRQDPSISAGFEHDDLSVSLSSDPGVGGVPAQGLAIPQLEPDGDGGGAAPQSDFDSGFVPQVPPQAPQYVAPPAQPQPQYDAPPAQQPMHAQQPAAQHQPPVPDQPPRRQSAFPQTQPQAQPPAVTHEVPPPEPQQPQAPQQQSAFPEQPAPSGSIPSLDEILHAPPSAARPASGSPFSMSPPSFGSGASTPPSAEIPSLESDGLVAPVTPPQGAGAFPTDPAAPPTTGGIFAPDVTAATPPAFSGAVYGAPAEDELAPPTGELEIPGFHAAPPPGYGQDSSFAAPLSGYELPDAPGETPRLAEDPPAPSTPDQGYPEVPGPGTESFNLPAPGAPQAEAPAPQQDFGGFAPGPDPLPNPATGGAPAPGAFQPGSFQPGGVQPPAAQPGSFQPGSFQPGSGQPGDPGGFVPGATMSPDDLARPMGWEAAGLSAVSAEDESEYIGYRPEAFAEPVPDPMPEPGVDEVGADADVASEVFSELSSLTSVRPKVEKTRAGLVKRERVPESEAPKPEPIAAPSSEHYDRDPEAIRTRVSSFYSGKFRAQADAAEFERTMQGASANEVTP